MARRIVGSAAAVMLLALAGGLMAAGGSQSLRSAGARIGILAGAAAAPQHFSDPNYTATLIRDYSMIEPENQMKWRATEPARGQFNFRPGDELVRFAQAHGMKVRGHNLLWAKFNPAWLYRGHFTPAQLREIMRQHITRVAGHYAGRVFAWDVVNEAFDREGHLRHSIWYDRPGIGLAGDGTAYIAQAFRWAHAADPKALLFYNDFDAEGINAKSDAIYAMVKDFKARGVPIDGVGLQAHLGLNAAGVSQLAANIARFGGLGVQVQITELDVRVPVNAQGQLLSSNELARQAKVYGRVAEACAQEPACTAFQTWGFTDRYSWIPHHTHEKFGFALPFSSAYKPKPAYYAILSAFKKAERNRSVTGQRIRLERERLR